MSKNEKICYLRDKGGHPIACIAYKYISDSDGNDAILWNYSVHNPRDIFNRTMARRVAIARFSKRPLEFCFNLQAMGERWKSNSFLYLLQEIASGAYYSPVLHSYPKRLVDGAKNYLLEHDKRDAVESILAGDFSFNVTEGKPVIKNKNDGSEWEIKLVPFKGSPASMKQKAPRYVKYSDLFDGELD